MELSCVFFCLLGRKEARVVDEAVFLWVWPPVVLFEEMHLHHVSRNERCLVLFVTELVPVDVSEPGVLLDFADGLGPLAHIFGE